MDINKIGYSSYEDAFEELTRIINTNYNPCPQRNKKPSRVYFSDITNLWHLTSSPNVVEYNK